MWCMSQIDSLRDHTPRIWRSRPMLLMFRWYHSIVNHLMAWRETAQHRSARSSLIPRRRLRCRRASVGSRCGRPLDAVPWKEQRTEYEQRMLRKKDICSGNTPKISSLTTIKTIKTQVIRVNKCIIEGLYYRVNAAVTFRLRWLTSSSALDHHRNWFLLPAPLDQVQHDLLARYSKYV